MSVHYCVSSNSHADTWWLTVNHNKHHAEMMPPLQMASIVHLVTYITRWCSWIHLQMKCYRANFHRGVAFLFVHLVGWFLVWGWGYFGSMHFCICLCKDNHNVIPRLCSSLIQGAIWGSAKHNCNWNSVHAFSCFQSHRCGCPPNKMLIWHVCTLSGVHKGKKGPVFHGCGFM